MREIRFRFYDEVTRRFLQPAAAEFNAAGELYTIRIGNKNLDLDRITINQFTGLKDKNGKEIYEGDILLVQWPDDIEDWEYAEVIWSDAGFRLLYDYVLYDISHSVTWPIDLKGKRFSDIWDDPETLVVERVGNIYENPELLKT